MSSLPLELTEHNNFYNEGPGLRLVFSHQAAVKLLETGRLYTSWSSNTCHFRPSAPRSLQQLETSVAARESEQNRWTEAKNEDLHCSPHPMTGSAYKPVQYSTHEILVSQFKNRTPGTILLFPAVFGLHIGSLFQPLFPPAFSLSFPSSCPRCSVAEYLPVHKRIIPLFSPRRMAASESAPIPVQLALAGSHPTATPAQLAPKEPQPPLFLPLRNIARDGWKNQVKPLAE